MSKKTLGILGGVLAGVGIFVLVNQPWYSPVCKAFIGFLSHGGILLLGGAPLAVALLPRRKRP